MVVLIECFLAFAKYNFVLSNKIVIFPFGKKEQSVDPMFCINRYDYLSQWNKNSMPPTYQILVTPKINIFKHYTHF